VGISLRPHRPSLRPHALSARPPLYVSAVSKVLMPALKAWSSSACVPSSSTVPCMCGCRSAPLRMHRVSQTRRTHAVRQPAAEREARDAQARVAELCSEQEAGSASRAAMRTLAAATHALEEHVLGVKHGRVGGDKGLGHAGCVWCGRW
jgi:hypothetical protein